MLNWARRDWPMKMRETSRAQDKKLADNNYLKKKIKEIPVIQEKFLSQCPSKKLGAYCWKTMMKPQMSYSFSEVHALLYSFIGIQTLVLATKFPIIYWNTACLIVNSQSIEEENVEENSDISCSEENIDEELEDIETEDEEEIPKKKEKKKQKTVNYGKVAAAIGKMVSSGITVSPPDVNQSSFTFSPNEKENLIRYGLRGITKIGEDLVKNIITNRPYSSIQDFLSKVKINKTQMINLIKCGAFDSFGKREDIMEDYVNLISDTKSVLNLRNMQMLINFNLIPDDFDMVRRVFNFNKYLKKFKVDNVFLIDNIAMNFIDKNFNIDNLQEDDRSESGFAILQTKWKKIYDSYMNKIRPYIKDHNKELLDAVNNRLTAEVCEKYTLGSISKWEMDSVSCYFHEHELKNVDYSYYGFSNYFELPENPEVDTVLNIRGKKIPLFKIHRICGTVLDRDKLKKTITLLTREGVVTVRIFGDVFNHYDRQISERGTDGKKHVIQKSFFSRGNKIIVTGIKREDSFQGKKYKSTPYHLVELIKDIKSDGTLITEERLEVD